MDNYIDVRTNKISKNLHKTEVQLQIGNPPGKSTRPLKNLVKNQVTPVIPDSGNNMEVTMWTCSPELRDHLDKEAMDDKTSGKSVSALINQFNKVNSSHMSLSDGDSKIPAKKVRTDFLAAVQEKAHGLPVDAEVVSHNHGSGTRHGIQTEIINTSCIRFTFKVNPTQVGHSESPKRDSLVDGQNGLRKVSIARPLVKLRSFKGSLTQDSVTRNNIAPNNVTQHSVTPCDLTADSVAQDDVIREDVSRDNVTRQSMTTDSVKQDTLTQENVTRESLTPDNVTLNSSTTSTTNHSPNFTRNSPQPKIYDASEKPLTEKHNNKPSGDGHQHDVPAKSPTLTSHTSPGAETPPQPHYAPDLLKYNVHLIDQVRSDDPTDQDVARASTQVRNLSSDVKGQSGEVTEDKRTKKRLTNAGKAQRVEITNQRTSESDRKLIADKLRAEFPSASQPGDLTLHQVSENCRVGESMPRDHSYLESDSKRGTMRTEHGCNLPDRSLVERSHVSGSIDCIAAYCDDNKISCVLESKHCQTERKLPSVGCSNRDSMKVIDCGDGNNGLKSFNLDTKYSQVCDDFCSSKERLQSLNPDTQYSQHCDGFSGSKDGLKSFNLYTQHSPHCDGFTGSKDSVQPRDNNRDFASRYDGMKLHDCDRKYSPGCDGCSNNKDGVKSLNLNTESNLHCDGMNLLDCDKEHAPQFGGCCDGKDVLKSVISNTECTPHEKGCRVDKDFTKSLDSLLEDGRCGGKDGQASDYSNVSGRINDKLKVLKTELMAIREMDLALLRQLISISQTIQRIQRSDVPKVSKSLSFLNRTRSLQYRYRPVQRQNSAPHCPDKMRFMFSNLRSATEDDLRDSLSSFDESEMDSQSELDESTTSLNIIVPNSPRSAANRRKMFRSRDVILSLETSSDADEDYEDILKRNVRLWKLSSQIHESFREEMAVWY